MSRARCFTRALLKLLVDFLIGVVQLVAAVAGALGIVYGLYLLLGVDLLAAVIMWIMMGFLGLCTLVLVGALLGGAVMWCRRTWRDCGDHTS